MASTYWERLAATGEVTYKTNPMRTKQRGMTAWEVDGALALRWEGELLELLGRICGRGENYAHIHSRKFLGIRFPRSLSMTISYHCFFLSPDTDVANARPTFVIKCWQLDVAKRAVEVLEKDTEVRNLKLGFSFLADDDTPRLSAGDGTADGSVLDNYDDFDSICGARIVVTSDLPANRDSSYRQATAGGVIVLNNEYYVVTCAHVFDDIGTLETVDDDEMEGDLDDGSNCTKAVSSTGLSSEDSQEHVLHAGVWPKTHALYAESTRHLAKDASHQEDDLTVKLSKTSHRQFLGHFFAHQNLTWRSPTRPASDRTSANSRMMCRNLDWAITSIADSRYFQINSWRSKDGELIHVRSVYDLTDSPGGAAVTLSGARGAQDAQCSGGVAGVTFPWSDKVQKMWTVEYQCAAGDSGAWVVDPETGCIYGMIVAISIKAQLAYMLPAKALFEDVLSHWSHCEQTLQNILPSGQITTAINPQDVGVTSQASNLRAIPDAVAEQSSESQMNHLLSLWLLHVPVAERQQLEKDSALGSDMADLSMQESRLLKPLRDLKPILRQYAQIPETDFVLSVDFLRDHAEVLGSHQVEMLLKAGVDFCKQKNQYTARAVIHQAALLHRRLTWSEKDFQAFRSGIVQENYNTIDSWFWEVSQSFKELTKIVPEEMGADPTRAIRSHYAELVFDLDLNKSVQPNSIPIRGTPGLAESADHRYRIRNKPEQFFQPGRVFEMLWTFENVPSLPSSLSRSGHEQQSRDISSNVFRPFVRRMVVIEQKDQISSCLAISSYGGRGVAKRGFTTQDQHLHAIIHMAGVQPAPVAGEEGMDLRPIAVESYDDRVLDSMSRINFATTYEVGWDVKVRHLGKVPQSSMENLHTNHAAIRAEMRKVSTAFTGSSTVQNDS